MWWHLLDAKIKAGGGGVKGKVFMLCSLAFIFNEKLYLLPMMIAHIS